jgi:hypothetical protein
MDPLGTDSGSRMIGGHTLGTTGAVDTVNIWIPWEQTADPV